jgi:FkbM family methyltransferase
MKNICKSFIKKHGIHYFKEKYLPFGIDLYVDLKRFDPGLKMDAVFDVGANEGQTYLEFRNAFPAAQIYSFEPCAQTYSKLCTTMAHDELAHPFKMGFGAQSKPAVLSVVENSQLNKIQSTITGIGDSEPIQIQTIDEFCGNHNIDFIDLLKTDTEGYDLEVLKGASKILASKRIRYVYTETTFEKSDDQHTYFPLIFNYLTSFGYSFLGLYHPYYHNSPIRIQFCNALFIS